MNLEEYILEYDESENLKPTGNENIEMLRSVLKFAKEEVYNSDHFSRFSTEAWIRNKEFTLDVSVTGGILPDCGTTICLAGTAVWMGLEIGQTLGYRGCDINVTEGEFFNEASSILGLNNEQANFLFYIPNDIELIESAMNYITGEDLS